MPEVLRGDLGHVSLGALLQLAETEFLCGTLTVEGGEVVFHNGGIGAARFGSQDGSGAIVEALVRASGSFSVRTADEEATARAPIGSTMSFVLESCRVLDEAERLAGMLLKPRPDFKPSDDGLAKLVGMLDGRRSLGEAVIRADVALSTVVDALGEAFSEGQLRAVGPASGDLLAQLAAARPVAETPEAPSELVAQRTPEPATPTPAPAPERSFDELVFEARRYTRARDYKAAEELLQAALAARPGHRIAVQNLNRIRSLRADPV